MGPDSDTPYLYVVDTFPTYAVVFQPLTSHFWICLCRRPFPYKRNTKKHIKNTIPAFINPRAKCTGVSASSPPNWDINIAINPNMITAMNPIIRAMICFSSFLSYDPFFLPQCNFQRYSGRHICSSTDRSSPKSSISNAICILSYAQTGIMKRNVLTVWQPETSCQMLPVRCIRSRFEPDVDF